VPPPHRANTGPAAAARRLSAAQRRLNEAADALRAAGWTVVEPDGDGETESAYINAQFGRIDGTGATTEVKLRSGGVETDWITLPPHTVDSYRHSLARQHRDR